MQYPDFLVIYKRRKDIKLSIQQARRISMKWWPCRLTDDFSTNFDGLRLLRNLEIFSVISNLYRSDQ